MQTHPFMQQHSTNTLTNPAHNTVLNSNLSGLGSQPTASYKIVRTTLVLIKLWNWKHWKQQKVQLFSLTIPIEAQVGD